MSKRMQNRGLVQNRLQSTPDTLGRVKEIAGRFERTMTDCYVNQRRIKKLKIDKSNAERRLKRASDDGYIRNLEGKPGRPGCWVVGEPLPDELELLPQPATLCNPEIRVNPSGCVVAWLRGCGASRGIQRHRRQ
jgi:hypothetical protein